MSTTDDATTSSTIGIIRVLVAAMGDSARSVQEAAASALCQIAQQNAEAVLDCCATSLRAGKRVVSYRAGLLLILAYTVREMREEQINISLMRSTAKLAMTELAANKEDVSDWNSAASNLLVAVGSRSPDLLMDETFNQLAGGMVPVVHLVQTLAEFASSCGLQFAPRLKNVLSRVLPILSNVTDNHRQAFANAFTFWCDTVNQCNEVCLSNTSPEGDLQALLQQAFELLLNSWIKSPDSGVRLATAEALGKMVDLISRKHLISALPRLLPSILAVCRKEKENPLPATTSLHTVLSLILVNDARSPMIDFLALSPVLNMLLLKAYLTVKKGSNSAYSAQMKNHNEVLRCFVTIREAYPSEIFDFLLHQLRTREEYVQLGVLSVWKHLIFRQSEPWLNRRGEIAEAVNYLLRKQDLKLKKSIAELIVCMASSGYLNKTTSEACIEFLVKQCALASTRKRLSEASSAVPEKPKATEMPVSIPAKKELGGQLRSLELRRVCETGLLLLAGTVPAAEVILWPFLLKMLMPVEYTAALDTVCKCITEVLKHKRSRGEKVSIDYSMTSNIPEPEELFARLLLLLQYPLDTELASRVLTILDDLGPIFPTAIVLLWEEEIPKLKAYISNIDVASWQQIVWEDMIIHLLSDALGVVHDPEWIMSFGNALATHYNLYDDNQQISLLHRCMGTVLQKTDNEVYVQRMITLMYQRSDVSNKINRGGLATAMGLVASAHLDTVLAKLRRILDNHKRNGFLRFVLHFVKPQKIRAVDNVFATLALMYGYTASYAPSSGIEARIEILVGSDMLKGFLKVKAQASKQAVLSAINLLGQAVIKAAKNGTVFPLKKRDIMLNYIISLMEKDEKNSLDIELQHTQEMALDACATLVSVNPKLTSKMRDSVLQAAFGFFTLPMSLAVSDTLFTNLTRFLCTILLTSGDDGKSRAMQLQFLLKRLDEFASSSMEYERERAVRTVLALLQYYRALCFPGSCYVGCTGSYMHLRSSSDTDQSGGAAGPALLPPREALRLGERIVAFLPRCTDVSPVIRILAGQIITILCNMVMLIPDPAGAKSTDDSIELSLAITALQDLTDSTKGKTDGSEVNVLQRVVDAVLNLLNYTESAQGAMSALTQIIYSRGSQLREGDICKIARNLFEAAAIDCDRHQGILAVVCSLAEHSVAKVVFSEIITAGEIELVDDLDKRKLCRFEKIILAISHHEKLSLIFLEYVVDILDHAPVFKEDDAEKGNISDHLTFPMSLCQRSQAATLALQEILRGANDTVKQAVNQCYPRVLCCLLLRIGSIQESISIDMQPLRDMITTIHVFSETVENDDMGKVLFTDGEQRLSGERWTEAVEEVASNSAREKPEEVTNMCTLLWPALERQHDCQRAAAAAALSGLVQHCENTSILLGSLVEALTAHTSDESSTVRLLCVRSLVQMIKRGVTAFVPEALNVIVALLEDKEDEVANAAVCGLSPVIQVASAEVVYPMLLNLCLRLSILQTRHLESTRAAAFEALGSVSKFATGVQLGTFMEQIHKILPRLVFHVNDEAPSVSLACKNALRSISPLLHAQDIRALVNLRTFEFGRSMEYDDFVKEFVKHLVLQFRDKVDIYVSCAIQAFESPWPVIQANSAYFVGCLLSRVRDAVSVAHYVPQVSNLLMKMTTSSPSALVRAKSTLALSQIMNEMEVLNT
ncbi:protein SHOOT GRAVITROPISM 6 isoform X4 [Physcomitrium patens]|uniref:protein SHOOT GRAVITROPISM 6 isoform X4 n=1 Tax=Physcomitrium patens TaxID=3218 RepID=UPI000D17422D|nr:protein SHOOT GRAVITROPISM 6-like isoform X4 [Physcomitrium patens]|eukprot:XP_024360918.1 protein SHOOT GRAVITROPISM 6-like isoform X4 [Physcomitrella patens]